ncbi:hypothetical protein diail_2893 [Diaporthe ilicicola]|nr:hypothetical protein diail_2893 [Diaporthe ilicicola]
MTVKTELAVLYALIVLLGVLSHLAIFNRVDWRPLAPLLIWVYSGLVVLLFLFLNSFESDLSTCFKYLFILVILYCMGLFTSITIVDSLRRKYRPIVQSRLEAIAIDSSSAAVLDESGTTCDKAMRKDTT